jgi:hypothetical protein
MSGSNRAFGCVIQQLSLSAGLSALESANRADREINEAAARG